MGQNPGGFRNQFTGETEATSDPMQPNVEDSLPSLSNQPTQAADNLVENGAVIQGTEQTLPGLGDAAPANNGSGNQEVDTILQKMASGQRLSNKEVDTLIQGENREAVETALGTTLPKTKSAARRFVRDLEAKAQAGVADNNEHAEANLPGLQEPLDQQEIPGYTETEMSTGGAENGYAGAEVPSLDGRGSKVRTGERGGLRQVRGDVAERGVFGQSNRGIPEVSGINSDIRNSLSNAGVTDFQLAPTEDKHGFSEALSAAKQSNLNGAAVDSKTPEELQDAVTFISPDGMAGGAVEPNGNITAVFKNANSSGRKAGIDIAFAAIAHGGDRLDCYGPFLVNTYAQAGMEPVARIKYTWGINPEMDAQVQRQLSEGDLTAPPDIYFMKRRDGISLEQAAADYAAGDRTWYTQKELDALPLFEGENAYDEALAYRDSLIQNTGNAEQRLPGLEGESSS